MFINSTSWQVSLLFTTSRYNITRRPSQYTYRPRRRRRRRKEEHNLDNATLVGSAISPSEPATSLINQTSGSLNGQPPAFPRPPLRHTSRSTTNSRPDRRSWRLSASSSGGDLQCPSPDTLHERCDTLPDDEGCLDPDLSLSRFDSALVQQRITDAIYLSPSAASQLPDPLSIRDDRELHNFVDRFRTLVSQITRETEDALEYARSEPYVTEREVESDDDESDEGYPQWYYPHTPMPPPAAMGFDEFGRSTPYPPDEHIRILNQFVRRMPTIESLGSRELASITSSMGRTDGERMTNMSMHTLSRPPTRTMTDFTGSEPPSRAATPAVSLSLNMGVLPGPAVAGSSSVYGSPQTPKTPSFRSISSMGEMPADRDESPLDSEFGVRTPSLRGGNGQLSHSRSTFSFHTANSGGTGTVSSPTSEAFASTKSSPSEDTQQLS
ncbi:hypothetical protein PQX77_007208 [Marasmius sp. AFHP31]|nr:hypothetical protein PQX77_007208 [Marasmius sp. AFHP31]